jgi:hypothetical protein
VTSDVEQAIAAPVILDTPVHRTTIDQLDRVTLEQFITNLRDRRLRLVRAFQAAEQSTRIQRQSVAKDKALKALEKFNKRRIKIDAELEKLQDDLNKINVFLFEMGDMWVLNRQT